MRLGDAVASHGVVRLLKHDVIVPLLVVPGAMVMVKGLIIVCQ